MGICNCKQHYKNNQLKKCTSDMPLFTFDEVAVVISGDANAYELTTTTGTTGQIKSEDNLKFNNSILDYNSL